MPLESIMQPVSLFSDLSEDVTAKTVSKINYMVQEKLATEQAAAAVQAGSGDIWQDALAEVMLEDENGNERCDDPLFTDDGSRPLVAERLLLPVWSEGKISVLPATKFAQALSSFRSPEGAPQNAGTWAGDMISYVGDVPQVPKKKKLVNCLACQLMASRAIIMCACCFPQCLAMVIQMTLQKLRSR